MGAKGVRHSIGTLEYRSPAAVRPDAPAASPDDVTAALVVVVLAVPVGVAAGGFWLGLVLGLLRGASGPPPDVTLPALVGCTAVFWALVAAARQLLTRHLRERKPTRLEAHGVCAWCGYSLRDNVLPRGECPKCGTINEARRVLPPV